MDKPGMLVLTATGKTGMPVALQLLDKGFPVTAFVHRADQRSERLKAKGAEIVVGSLTDITDMETLSTGSWPCWRRENHVPLCLAKGSGPTRW